MQIYIIDYRKIFIIIGLKLCRKLYVAFGVHQQMDERERETDREKTVVRR